MKHTSCDRLRTRFQMWAQMGLIVALIGITGCSLPRKLTLVTVAPNADGFVAGESAEPFVPWGTNYYDPNTGWPPQVWQQFDAETVNWHFRIMGRLGVNCVRVFLAAATFQPDVDTIDEEALEKLDALVKIARRNGIRLVLTGPDHWEGAPTYWEPDRFAGEDALKALEHFWTVVGQRYCGDPTIFAWDLLNEPSMPWMVESWAPRWNAWLESKYKTHEALKAAWGQELQAAETFGQIAMAKDIAKPGNPRLLEWQLFREHLADEWVRRQVDVLREVDPTHMITVGYIQCSYPVVRPGEPSLYSAFNPQRQAQWLDFVSVHFYPLMGRPFGSRANWQRNLAYLQTVLAYCQAGKPVVLGEYGWYGGGSPQGRPRLNEDEQARWLTAEIEASRQLASGWLSWPFANTPDATDMSVFGGMVEASMAPKLWALHFRAFADHLPVLSQPTPTLPAFDFMPSLTAPLNDLVTMHDDYAAQVQKALEKEGSAPELDLVLPAIRSEELLQK